MQVLVTGRHVEIPPEVREYVDTKVSKLPRYYDRIHEIELIFDHESEEQLSVELIVRAGKKQTFVAREEGPDAIALIDQVTDKVERQLKRHKEKNRNHKHDGRPEITGTEE